MISWPFRALILSFLTSGICGYPSWTLGNQVPCLWGHGSGISVRLPQFAPGFCCSQACFCGWIRPGECCILKPAFQCASVEHKSSSLCRCSSFYKGWKNLTLRAIKYWRGREKIVQGSKSELVLCGFIWKLSIVMPIT